MAPNSSTLAWKIPWMDLVMLEEGVCYDQCVLLEELYYPLPCFIQRRKWQPTPVFLPGESQGRRSLVGCHLWGRAESDMTEVT